MAPFLDSDSLAAVPMIVIEESLLPIHGARQPSTFVSLHHPRSRKRRENPDRALLQLQ
jgi:hypothetical protein